MPPKSSLPPGVRYTTDRTTLIKLLRERNFSDAEILNRLTANEYGKRRRRELIEEWAPILGLSPAQAVEVAKKAGIIG